MMGTVLDILLQVRPGIRPKDFPELKSLATAGYSASRLSALSCGRYPLPSRSGATEDMSCGSHSDKSNEDTDGGHTVSRPPDVAPPDSVP